MSPARDVNRKTLVAAALAGALYTSSSGATIATSSLDAELFLNLINTSASVSATFDLGIPTVISQPAGSNLAVNPTIRAYSTDALAGKGIQLQWNLAATSAWSSFVGAAGAQLSTSKYDIKAVGPAFDPDAPVFLTTIASGNAANQSFGALLNFAAVGETFVRTTNTVATHSSQPDGANFVPAGAPPTLYHQTAVGDRWQTNLLTQADSSTGLVGSSLPFYKLYGNADNFADDMASWAMYDGVWKLDGTGLLTYSTAPIPEPESWALLVVGLAAVGACVRRRGAVRKIAKSN